MFSYCVECLRLSEDSAAKRIQAARAARRVPLLFAALTTGKLHLSAVWLLAPHITPENAEELIEAATHRRKSEIEAFLARTFPAFGAPLPAARITPVGSGMFRAPQGGGCLFDEHAPGHVGNGNAEHLQHAPGHVGDGDGEVLEQHAPGHVDTVHALHVEAASQERYLVRVTIARSTHDKLRHAQALLSHAVPSGDVAQVLDRALDALIARLERRKVGAALPKSSDQDATGFSGRGRARRAAPRYIPAQVRRAVWERDGGRCTFVGAGGHRCTNRRLLEFDHAEPFARGGMATVEGLRIRCRAHNQFGAERAFGAEFMRMKRHEARVARQNAAAQRAAMAERAAADQREAARKEQTKDLEAALRGLGCRADEARRAANYAMAIEGATFEDRLRAALAFRSRRTATRTVLTEACEVRERRAHYGWRTWRRYGSRPLFSRMTSQLRDEPSLRLRPSSQPHGHPTERCR
ncbi:MAG TPA: RuvA C-terminal domain-containing protein [Candidatus Eisenbacteria bacterium]|nr:RuvA C-terminal domain-containing protein [Candidatus Eisenbacteria bacterium]